MAVLSLLYFLVRNLKEKKLSKIPMFCDKIENKLFTRTREGGSVGREAYIVDWIPL